MALQLYSDLDAYNSLADKSDRLHGGEVHEHGEHVPASCLENFYASGSGIPRMESEYDAWKTVVIGRGSHKLRYRRRRGQRRDD